MIHWYIGIPGSGKTYLATQDQKRDGGILLDDDFYLDDLESAIRKNQHIYITDPYLILIETRKRLLEIINNISKKFGPLPEITCHVFENNPQKAWNNIISRNDGRIISLNALVNYFSRYYNLPTHHEILPIWQQGEDNEKAN